MVLPKGIISTVCVRLSSAHILAAIINIYYVSQLISRKMISSKPSI